MLKVAKGDVFSQLTVIEQFQENGRNWAACQCACGRRTKTQVYALKNGLIRSCGCVNKRSTKHSATGTPEYVIFAAMKARCADFSPGGYGAKGVLFLYECFEQFIGDVGPRPPGAMQIDREDNGGHYAPGNCRWQTPRENSTNTSKSMIWTINGVEYASCTLAAEALGISHTTVRHRCCGMVKGERKIPPTPGWSARPKYEQGR